MGAGASAIGVERSAFSAKLGVLIDRSSDACDMTQLVDRKAWPNVFDSEPEPALISDLKIKAMELVREYRSTLPRTSRASTNAQDTVDLAMSDLQTLVDQQKDYVDETMAFLLNVITERDADGNGIISQEEAITIAKAVYQITEEIPADNPLIVASVGKPLKVMAEILTVNTKDFRDSKAKIEEAERELSEARERQTAAVEELSLAHYPDLLAKTKDFKAYLDSLTEEQFAEAAAEVTENKNNWDAIIAGQGISECDFCIPELVTTATTTVTTETVYLESGEGPTGTTVDA